jgi:hypothetical protein
MQPLPMAPYISKCCGADVVFVFANGGQYVCSACNAFVSKR